MRILFVNHTSYAEEITGAEKSLYYDVRSLKERGYDVVVMSRKRGKSTELFRQLDVPVYVIPYDSPQLKRVIDRIKPDLVYVNTIGPVTVGEAADSLRIPVLWFIREIPTCKLGRVKTIQRHATAIVTISEAVERSLRAQGIKRRMERLPNAVDLDELDERVWPTYRAERRQKRRLGEERVVVGFVGKVTEKKGIAHFVDMAIRVGRREPRAAFFIFGHARSYTRPLIQQLKRRLTLAKISKRVFFLGFTQNIERIYPALDIVVVPSLADEPFGRVTVEAMAFHKPVVAYDSGASRELVVHGKTGFVVPKGDTRKLSKAVLELLDPWKRHQFGSAGRQRVEQNFSMRTHAELLEQLVQRYADRVYTNREKVSS